MGIASRLRSPRIQAAIFGTYFALVMLASWTFASGLTSPWFGPDLSRWIYGVDVIASGTFLVGLGILALQLQRSFELRVREINRKLGMLVLEGESASVAISAIDRAPESANSDGDSVDLEMDQLLETIGDAQSDEDEGSVLLGAVVPQLESPLSVDRVAPAREDLLDRRDALKAHQEFLVRFLPGPSVVALAICGVSAILLPGVEGPLQSSYSLNTAVILGFAYGWVGLAAYVTASFLTIVGSMRTERKRLVQSPKPDEPQNRGSELVSSED